MNTIDTIKLDNFNISIEKCDSDNQIQIIVEKNNKPHQQYIPPEIIEDVKITQIRVHNEVMSSDFGYDYHITNIMADLMNDDFTVSIAPKPHHDMDNVFHVVKEGIDFSIRKNEIDAIKGIIMYFPVIKNIVDKYSNENYVTYAGIQESIDKYIDNNKYKSIIFSKICNALHQRGVEINV